MTLWDGFRKGNHPALSLAVVDVVVMRATFQHLLQGIFAGAAWALVGVNLNVTPIDPEGELVFSYNTFAGEMRVNGSSPRIYTRPISGTVPPCVEVSMAGGISFVPVFDIVEPQLVYTKSAKAEGEFSVGDVLMGDLVTINYIAPFTVSFRGVSTMDRPA